MDCLLIINEKSSSVRPGTEKKALKRLSERYDRVDVLKIPLTGACDIRAASLPYGAVAVCGGDGTLNIALNALDGSGKEMIYIPGGTFNDAAHSLSKYVEEDGSVAVHLGKINGRLFSYVAAAGTFTAIGYKCAPRVKRRFGRLVYYAEVFREFKAHYVNATVTAPEFSVSGTFTVIMLLNSKVCFSFPFNRAYNPKAEEAHLLLIRSPEGNFRHLKLFLSFFRAFFIGFDGDKETKNIIFRALSSCRIETSEPQVLCLDGERFECPPKCEFSIGNDPLRFYLL